MPVFFFAQQVDARTGDKVVLRGDDAFHICKVLRLRPGDSIHVQDKAGRRHGVELESVGRNEVAGVIRSSEAVAVESPLAVTLGLPLIKGERGDEAVRMAVELGVGRIVPVACERTVVKVKPGGEARIARWMRVAGAAAKQCGRACAPRIENTVHTVEKFCHDTVDCDLKILFWEEEPRSRLLKCVSRTGPARKAALLTGPEGGFTHEEVRTARDNGFVTVSLGARILRADTAVAVAVALLQERWGDL